MRWVGSIAGALTLLAAFVQPAVAGLYNPAEPIDIPSRDFRKLQDTLATLRGSALPIVLAKEKQVVRTPRYRLNDLIATLDAAGKAKLTVDQRLAVSAFLMRLQKFREAANVLTPAQFQERDNFLVLSNLATAEQLDGDLRRARDFLSDALQLWPKKWTSLNEARRDWLKGIGWSEQDFLWFREVETYQLKLIRLRSKEALKAPKSRPDDVDGLFDDPQKPVEKLQFVGPSGHYEAGKLAPDQQAKLPKKAIEIVEQLLIWMPFDTRLSWLLGELYNAAGDVDAAKAIFEDVARKWDPRVDNQTSYDNAALPVLFKNHFAVLQQQTSADVKVAEPSAMASPAASSPGGISVDTQQGNEGPPVDWKSLGVGFGGGFVVAFLAGWQWREIRKKRRAGSVA